MIPVHHKFYFQRRQSIFLIFSIRASRDKFLLYRTLNQRRVQINFDPHCHDEVCTAGRLPSWVLVYDFDQTQTWNTWDHRDKYPSTRCSRCVPCVEISRDRRRHRPPRRERNPPSAGQFYVLFVRDWLDNLV